MTLRPQALRRIAGRYPFGHSKDIEDAPAGLEAGEVVTVRGPQGEWVGRGYWNAEGQTPLRLLSWQDEAIDAAFYRRRVQAALARRAGRVVRGGAQQGKRRDLFGVEPQSRGLEQDLDQAHEQASGGGSPQNREEQA